MRILLLLFCTCSLGAEPGPMPQEVRFDPYGDPLPRGALARLGTSRWRTEDPVVALVSHPEGTSVVAATKFGVIEFDRTTGRPQPRVTFPDAMQVVVLAADGQTVYTLTNHWLLRRWDVPTGKELPALSDSKYRAFAVSLDGQKLVACTEPLKREVHCYDLRAGLLTQTFTTDKTGFRDMALSADGKTLVGRNSNEQVLIVDLATKKVRREVQPDNRSNEPDPVQKYVLAPQGDRFAILDRHEIYAGSLSHERLEHLGDRKQSNNGYSDCCFTPDGQTLAVRTPHEIQLFGLANRKLVQRFRCEPSTTLHGFSKDGKTLLTTTTERNIQSWDVTTGKRTTPLWGHDANVNVVQFLPGGQTLVTAADDGTVRLWNTLGKELAQRRLPMDGMQLSDDGQHLYALTDHTKMLRLNPRTLATEQEVPFPTFDGYFRRASGRPLVTYRNEERAVVVADLTTNAEPRVMLTPNQRQGFPLLFAASGRLLLGEVNDIAAYVVWSTATGKVWRELPYNPDETPYYAMPLFAMAHDGRTLLTHAKNDRYRLWDLTTGAIRAEWRTASGHPQRVQLGPDLRTMVVYEDEQTLQFYRLGDAKPYATMNVGRLTRFGRIVYARDGQTFATRHADTTVLLWRTPLPPPPTPTKRPFAELWIDLANQDSALAFDAVLALESQPTFVRDLAKHVAPVQADNKAIGVHLAHLDHDRYVTREQAQAALQQMGDHASAAVRAALRLQPSVEAKQRLEAILKHHAEHALDITDNDRRTVRVIEVLEHLATPEARKLLATLATGTPEARVTQEANEALQRLKWR